MSGHDGVRRTLVIAAAAVALTGCNQSGSAANGAAIGNLTPNSDPARVDQAINRTDNESGASNTVEAATNQVAY